MDRRISIALDPEDILELKRIVMDGDEKAALRFLSERIERRVDALARAHMKRPFD